MLRSRSRRAAAASRVHQSSLVSSQFEGLEPRQLMDGDVRSYDGTGNNLTRPNWGAADAALVRLGPVA